MRIKERKIGKIFEHKLPWTSNVTMHPSVAAYIIVTIYRASLATARVGKSRDTPVTPARHLHWQ